MEREDDVYYGEGINYPQESTSYLHQYEEIPVNPYADLQVNMGYDRPPYPPGIRFNPTDEELVAYYLTRKVHGEELPCNVVIDVDLKKYHPKELAENFKSIVKDAWYIFTSRDRKYAKGDRPNRSAGSGYWKATGSNQVILDQERIKRIGYKKSLVYHEGKQPSKIKTGWMMHEYRINDSHKLANPADKTMLLDTWVLCKIYYKPINHSGGSKDHSWGSKDNDAIEKDTSVEETSQVKPPLEQPIVVDSKTLPEPPLDFPFLDKLCSDALDYATDLL